MATPVSPEIVNAAVEAATAAAQVAHAEESVLGALGVNWKLFIAQLINFSVVLFVMWKWVYTPLIKIIDARTAKIDKGLNDAHAAAAAKSGAEKASEEAIVAARNEAQRILEEAQKAAEAQRSELKTTTQAELAALVQQGVAQRRVALGEQLFQRRVVRLVGLQEHLGLLAGATGASRHLRDQLGLAFERADVAAIQRLVDIDDTHQRQPREIVALGQHLRAHQYPRRVTEIAQLLFQRIATLRGAAIDAHHRHVGETLGQRFLDTFGAGAL